MKEKNETLAKEREQSLAMRITQLESDFKWLMHCMSGIQKTIRLQAELLEQLTASTGGDGCGL